MTAVLILAPTPLALFVGLLALTPFLSLGGGSRRSLRVPVRAAVRGRRSG
ncbi:hypothetical protein C8N38_11272 [Rhodovulum kholense]|uniref:Uncharacterized protein n=1 Tax=Rhodovulum kholense TaxID=453584 RepID=A0A8E2VHM3_9RHOB|nr:hypothetical protein C8N38_11272 [Rhodovulum kholense]